jgi:hypothetical protein
LRVSFTLPLKIGVVSASQPPEKSLGWKWSRPCQKKAITGTGTGEARQSAVEYVKGGAGLCWSLAPEIQSSRTPSGGVKDCFGYHGAACLVSRCAVGTKGSVLTSDRLPQSHVISDGEGRYGGWGGERKRERERERERDRERHKERQKERSSHRLMCKRRLTRDGLAEPNRACCVSKMLGNAPVRGREALPSSKNGRGPKAQARSWQCSARRAGANRWSRVQVRIWPR